MPKGYWIASLDVTDVDTYKLYVEANAEAFAKYEGRFLTRGGPYTQLEGKNRSRNCILEFKDVETALACYRSPEYQKARAVRRHVALADIIIMAGYDGPQPPEQPHDDANVQTPAMYMINQTLDRAFDKLPDWAKRELDPICGVALTEAQIDDDLTAACQS